MSSEISKRMKTYESTESSRRLIETKLFSWEKNQKLK
jgi:hypothetical protein